jgi:hypothetical protein
MKKAQGAANLGYAQIKKFYRDFEILKNEKKNSLDFFIRAVKKTRDKEAPIFLGETKI